MRARDELIVRGRLAGARRACSTMPLSGTMSAAVTQPRCSIACCTMAFSSSALSPPAPVREPAESVSSSSRSLSSEVTGAIEIVDERAREQIAPQAFECGAQKRVRQREAARGIRLAGAARPAHHRDDRDERVQRRSQPAEVDGQAAVEHAQLAGAGALLRARRAARLRSGWRDRDRWSFRSSSACRRPRRTRVTLIARGMSDRISCA